MKRFVRVAMLAVLGLVACGGDSVPRREDAALADGGPARDASGDAGLDGGDGGSALLALAPTGHDFGAQAVGTSSPPAVFTIRNAGTGASGPLEVSLSGIGGVFSLASDHCTGLALAPGESCTVTLGFAPTTAGAVSADVTITGAPGGSVSAPLQGLGVAVGILEIAPLAHDFGAVVAGTPSLASSFTVTNTGAAATGALASSVSGSDAAAFVVSSDTCAGKALAAHATCALTLRFVPGSAGAKTASLMLRGTPGGAAVAMLSGSGLTPASFAISPAPQALGSVVVGQSGAATTFTVRNTGGVPSGVMTIALTGPANGQFQSSADACTGQTLAPGAACTVAVAFAPQSPGPKTAVLTVSATPGGSASAGLTGTALAGASLSMSPTLQGFGPVGTGQVSSSVRFTISNTGGVPSGPLAPSLGGPDAIAFAIMADGCTGLQLAANASCTVDVRFAPATLGPKTGTLDVSGVPGGLASAALSGTGVAPSALSISPSPLAFGSVVVGGSSAPVDLTVRNSGSLTTGALSVALGGTDGADFSTVSDACTGATLAGGASCIIAVRFAPLTPGQKMASLTLSGSPGGTATAVVNGIALLPTRLSVTPAAQSFAPTVAGSAGPIVSFTVSNTGGVASGLLSASLGGGDAGQWTVLADTCAGVALLPAASCNIDVGFTPTSAGAKTATLTVDGTHGNTTSAALSGTGLIPATLSIAPATRDFGALVAGAASAPVSFTVTNAGEVPSGNLASVLGGAEPGEFSVISNGCAGSALGAGGRCTIDVRFTPSSPGAKLASLTVAATPGGAPMASLTGTGLLPAVLDLTPAAHDFGSVVVGQPAGGVAFTVHNGGEVPSGQLATTLGGTGAASFVVLADGCAGSPLGGGASCMVTVRFDPPAPGARTATLTVAGTPGGSPSSQLDGDGLAPAALGITAAHDFGTVLTNGGGSAPATLTVTNGGGVATGILATSLTGSDPSQFAVVTDGCAGLPLGPGASCTIDVHMLPTTAGAKSAQLLVSGVPGGSAGASLSGLGQTPAALAIEPAAQAFGNIVNATTSTAASFVVTNGGGQTTGPLASVLGGTDGADFLVDSDGCTNRTLASGATCSVTVRFAPGTLGPKTASLSVSGTPGGSISAPLTGTSVAPAALTITPTPQSFGALLIGQTGAPITFTVTNTGAVPTGALATGLTGAEAAEFTRESDGCAGAVLGAGLSCTIAVRFAPVVAGPKTASLGVSGTPGGAVSSALSGTGLAPAQLSIAPASQDFGTLVAGQTGGGVSFTVSNTGGVATGTLSVGLPGGQFEIVSDGCAASALGAHTSCTISARFAPTSAGTKLATLTVSGSPGGSATASFTGVALQPATLTIAPASQDFGAIVTGSSSDMFTFTVTNTGQVPSGNLATALLGSDALQFTLVSNGCSGAALLAGDSCAIDVRFAPTAAGARSASLTASASPGGGAAAGLTGTGLLPAALSIAPLTQDFGDVVVGAASNPVTFTVTNSGQVPSGVLTTTRSGLDPSHFTIVSDGCAGAPLPGPGTCAIVVRFTPTAAGARSALLAVSGTPGGSPTASLTGNGLAPAALSNRPAVPGLRQPGDRAGERRFHTTDHEQRAGAVGHAHHRRGRREPGRLRGLRRHLRQPAAGRGPVLHDHAALHPDRRGAARGQPDRVGLPGRQPERAAHRHRPRPRAARAVGGARFRLDRGRSDQRRRALHRDQQRRRRERHAGNRARRRGAGAVHDQR